LQVSKEGAVMHTKQAMAEGKGMLQHSIDAFMFADNRDLFS